MPRPAVKRYLHLLPSDVARGAQVYARSLRHALDGPGCEHRTMVIFDGPPVALHPDMSVGARSGRLRVLDPIALIRLRVSLSRWRPDVVVAHGSEALKYTVLTGTRTRLVYYAIGVSEPSVHRPPRRWLHRYMISRADVVAAVSQETADELRDLLRVPPKRLRLIPNGRDPAQYRPRGPRGAGEREPTVVFVGHLTPSKRPQQFIEVVRRLRDGGQHFRAEMVGDGPLAQELRAAAAAAGVEMMGRRDDVPEVLADADVFVFTSEVQGEGMPGVLIEAALAGLPVVATDVPGASTVILHGATGFVVPVDNSEAMVEAIRRLVGDPSVRARMGAAAREHAVREFGLEASVDKWRRLLSELGP